MTASAAHDLLAPDIALRAASANLHGVDLSHWNGDIDFTKLPVGFVVLKAGGSDDGTYTDSKYVQWAAAVRAAKKHLGHYWFNGTGDPVADADHFVKNLAHYEDEDLLVLDIEAEANTAGTPWSPGAAMKFFQQVKRQKPKARLFAYMSASVTREHDWSALVKFGVKLWVASYGVNDGKKPAGNPVIGSWKTWSIWQYTSVGRVAGAPSDVDLDIAHEILFAPPAPPKPAPKPAPKPVPKPAPAPAPKPAPAPAPKPAPVPEPKPVPVPAPATPTAGDIYERSFVANQPVKPNIWTTVFLEDAADGGGLSFIYDQAGTYSIIVNLQVGGVAIGESFQTRLAITDDAGNLIDHTPVVEFAGTSGATFASFARFVALAKGQRLRVQVAAFTDNVVLTTGDVQWRF